MHFPIFMCKIQDCLKICLLQVFAKGLLYLGMNTAGLFIHYLTDHAQRQVFLETRRCIEGRLKLEQENQRQVLLLLVDMQHILYV